MKGLYLWFGTRSRKGVVKGREGYRASLMNLLPLLLGRRSAGFQPAVSQCFQPADSPTDAARRSRQRSADWKSAIQQVGNLRYAELAGLCQRPCETSREQLTPNGSGLGLRIKRPNPFPT